MCHWEPAIIEYLCSGQLISITGGQLAQFVEHLTGDSYPGLVHCIFSQLPVTFVKVPGDSLQDIPPCKLQVIVKWSLINSHLQEKVFACHVNKEVVSVRLSHGFRPDQRMWGSFGFRGGEILTQVPGEQNVGANTRMKNMIQWWDDANHGVCTKSTLSL